MIEKYANELGKGTSLTSYEDLEYVKAILPFLGTSYVTSNMYMLEVVGIWHEINDLLNCSIKDSATHR